MDWFGLLCLFAIWIFTCLEVDGNCCNKNYNIDSPKKIESPGYPAPKAKHTCAEYKYTINAPCGTTIRATCAVFNVECSKNKFKNYLKIGSTKECGKSFPSTLTSSNKITMSFKSGNFKAKKKNWKTFKFSCVFKVLFPPLCPTPVCDCGDTSFGSHIVGRVEAAQGEFPYQVSIQKADGFHTCGGSLISDEWVVSAARCRIDAKTYKVVLGTLKINGNSDTEQKFNIQKVINHPNYDSLYNRNDVALVRLSRKVTFSENVKPICLPDPFEDHSFIGSAVQASGWGRLVENGSSRNALHKVELHVISNTECSSKGDRYLTDIFNESICTITPGKGSCKGDSGGPIAYFTGCKFFLVGIRSWGNGCAEEDYPEVYTDVSNHYILKWIKNNAGVTCTAPTVA